MNGSYHMRQQKHQHSIILHDHKDAWVFYIPINFFLKRKKTLPVKLIHYLMLDAF